MPVKLVHERCWDVADRNIQRYWDALKDPKKNHAVCWAMIDKWLDYRFKHGPDDVNKTNMGHRLAPNE